MNRTSTNSLTRRQKRLIPLLVSMPTQQAACDEMKISRSTLHQWKQDEGFKDALEQAQNDAFRESLSRVKVNAAAAVDTLLELMKIGKQDVRARCATVLLERAIELRRLEDVETRLSEIEKALGSLR